MGVDIIKAKAGTITAKISEHYVDNARNLPWRVPPAESARGILPDPYHVWLSEVMLQQTTVAAVIGFFQKFTERWPTLADMAAADQTDILAQWAGLGYYARARNLHKCSRQIVENHDGIFPQIESELLKLPGVGAYTAAAIAAIAFHKRAVVVDANIERLMARLFAIDTPLPGGKDNIRIAMDRLTPESGAGDFAQACMDIGADICTARKPKCETCPVRSDCAALRIGDVERYPVKPAKKAKPMRKGRFFWIEQDDQILLITRPEKGMLGSMKALPGDNWEASRNGNEQPPFKGPWQIHENIVQHSFTHFSLEVDLAVYQGDKIVINSCDSSTGILSDAIWWPKRGIDDAGLPTLFAKAVRWKMKEQK